MSDSDTAGFGKFGPGFDFLQNLAKGASASVPQMPSLGSWVAPTLTSTSRSSVLSTASARSYPATCTCAALPSR